MSTPLKVLPIVEGHGEVTAVPLLIRRICAELLNGRVVPKVLTPIRRPRDRLLTNKDDTPDSSLKLAMGKLRQDSLRDAAEMVLILVDADDECPAKLGPDLRNLALALRSDAGIAVVLAVVEFETWFVAAADSLTKPLNIDNVPQDPESQRCGKGWIAERFRGIKYGETVDQAKLTAAMDLALCRNRSPSFDKLCREFESHL